MGVLYVLSIGLLAVSSMTKVIVHVILDSRNGFEVEYTSVRGYVYMLPYNKEVKKEDEKLKSVCNILSWLSLIFLIFFLLLFFYRQFFL